MFEFSYSIRYGAQGKKNFDFMNVSEGKKKV